jgi:high-affinity iron transporter
VPDTVIPYFLYSLGIIVREGLEAMLVVVALAAGTRSVGGRNRSRDVYRGALLAIAVSIVLAWAVNHIITDNASDTLEGVFQFLAAATLFYVSSWLTAKSQADKWLKFISEQVERAEKSSVPGFALGLASFLAVVREGGETIVFFKALTEGTTAPIEMHAIFAGLGAGIALLAIIFWVLTRASYRIPVGAFFWVTSILLYALAVVFVGQGVASWQESGILGATFIEHLPEIPMLGFYPTVQSIGAQVALIILALASFFAPRRGSTGKLKVPAEQPQSAPRPT